MPFTGEQQGEHFLLSCWGYPIGIMPVPIHTEAFCCFHTVQQYNLGVYPPIFACIFADEHLFGPSTQLRVIVDLIKIAHFYFCAFPI